jgi:hypothetical protein
VHYQIQLPDGETDLLRKDWVDQAVETGVLVDYDPVQKARKEEAAARRAAAAAEERRVTTIRSKKWPAKIEQAAIAKEILLGINEAQVTMSWGKPERINRTVTPSGVSQQWVYGSTYLYFERGVLVSYQDSRRP